MDLFYSGVEKLKHLVLKLLNYLKRETLNKDKLKVRDFSAALNRILSQNESLLQSQYFFQCGSRPLEFLSSFSDKEKRDASQTAFVRLDNQYN